VLFMEHKHLYRRVKGEVAEGIYETPFRAAWRGPGSDLVVIAYGAMVGVALRPPRTSRTPRSRSSTCARWCARRGGDPRLGRRCSKVVIIDEANQTCAAGAQVAR